MYWMQIILLVLSSNLDDFGFGFACGLKGPLKWWVAAVIGFMSGFTMWIGMMLSSSAVVILKIDDRACRIISAVIYVAIALWFAIDAFRTNKKDQTIAVRSETHWNMITALIMGVALGIDSTFIGVAAGMLNFPILITSLLAALSSFGLIYYGAKLAGKIRMQFICDNAGYISAGILILLALLSLL